MSALINLDPHDPPLTRRPREGAAAPAGGVGAAGQTGAPARAEAERNWPDPLEVTPPQVTPPTSSQPRPAATIPLAARWPVEPLPQSWPPLPGRERRAEPEPEPVDFPEHIDDLGAIPGGLFSPPHSTLPRRARAEATRPATGGAPAGVAQAGVARVFGPGHGPVPGVVAGAAAPAGAPMPRDRSPSRTAYRLHRLWLTPSVRHFVRLGVPVMLALAVSAAWLSDSSRRESLFAAVDSVRSAIENRPEFRVNSIDVIAASPEVAQGVAQLLDLNFPVSSFQLDLTALRARAETLDAVEAASVRVRAGGVLELRIKERAPAMVWRNTGGLELLDAQGRRVARVASRAARPDLPLIAGEGAPEAIAEARRLWAGAAPIQARIRGMVRVGQRRWDIELTQGQRIMLPADGAEAALQRVLALNAAQDLLQRDVVAVDLRDPARPTLRLSESAMRELNRIRRETSGVHSR